MNFITTKFVSLLLGVSLVAANSAPSSDINQHTDFYQNQISSAYPVPVSGSGAVDQQGPTDRSYAPMDVWVFATINISYYSDESDEFVNRSEKAKYGEGKILNVEGKLVHITSPRDLTDHTGCDEDMLGTKGKPIPNEPWIALIKRGKCNFEEKVNHAYKHNASGVIVYNDRDSINLDKMKILGKDRHITAVFTYKWVGEDFAKLVEEDKDVTVSINEGMRGGRMIGNINRTSVLFVSISFIVLMIISLIWLVFYYVQRFRYLQTKDKQSRRLCSVAKRIISKIPLKNIKSDDKEIDSDCCAICIEPYKVADQVRVLPCKHEYHKVCIDPWLLEHRTCPMCKLDILKHYGFVFTGSQESILQLEDYEDVEIEINNPSARRNSVSPLPQIRGGGSSNRLSHTSTADSDSEHEVPSPTEETPSLTNYSSRVSNKNEICVSCLAAALKKSRKSVDSALLDETDDVDASPINTFRHSSISLPTTLKKYKGHHSTEACKHLYASSSRTSNKDHQKNAESNPYDDTASSASQNKYNKSRSNKDRNASKANVSSFSASVSCDKILNTTNSNNNALTDFDDSDDNVLLDSVIVASIVGSLEQKINE
ncbi:E3 ubiquitin-protein ligase goliath [Culicoides brevitarsis]|uniref:E3 ubiquitin-protein ligase goliath n=1 Tax=Culicoides brevitarsis TaxID=469753 RepID=UPI00307C4CEE